MFRPKNGRGWSGVRERAKRMYELNAMYVCIQQQTRMLHKGTIHHVPLRSCKRKSLERFWVGIDGWEVWVKEGERGIGWGSWKYAGFSGCVDVDETNLDVADRQTDRQMDRKKDREIFMAGRKREKEAHRQRDRERAGQAGQRQELTRAARLRCRRVQVFSDFLFLSAFPPFALPYFFPFSFTYLSLPHHVLHPVSPLLSLPISLLHLTPA